MKTLGLYAQLQPYVRAVALVNIAAHHELSALKVLSAVSAIKQKITSAGNKIVRRLTMDRPVQWIDGYQPGLSFTRKASEVNLHNKKGAKKIMQ